MWNIDLNTSNQLMAIFGNICMVMCPLWSEYIKVIFPCQGPGDPYSHSTVIFYFFFALITESGSPGPKFKSTAKNNTSGFFLKYIIWSKTKNLEMSKIDSIEICIPNVLWHFFQACGSSGPLRRGLGLRCQILRNQKIT